MSVIQSFPIEYSGYRRSSKIVHTCLYSNANTSMSMTNKNWTLKSMMVCSVLALSLLSITATNSFAVPVGNTWARADSEPYIPPGTVDCVGLTDIAEVASIECKLFDDTNCPKGPDVPCAVGTDASATSPPTFGDVPGGCGAGCEEYRVTFDPVAAGADLTPQKELHFTITFLNSDGEPIAVQGKDVRTHSFLVIPESPIGIAALVMSSLAALGGFMFLRSRKSMSLPNNL